MPVIASENVSARCLVEANGTSAVFCNEDVEGLTQLLHKLFSDPSMLSVWRINASSVKALIDPCVAAQYMYDVLRFYFFQEGERPCLHCCGY